MAGNGGVRSAHGHRDHGPRSRRRLAGARGRARLAVQARGSLKACAWQGVWQGSSPEWRVSDERAELGQAVAHIVAGRRDGGRR
jgi:hypothetical protein